MELKQYFNVVFKWFWLIAACVIVASVSSYLSTRTIPRVYQATTTVRVGQAIEEANPSYQDFYTSEQLAQTYADIVKRRPILEAVAQALDLSYIPNPGNITAGRVPNTQLLQISVRDTDPQMAVKVADEIANQLILQSPTGSDTVQRDREFILGQIDDLKAKIQQTTDEINAEQAKLDAANSARAIQQYQSNIAALDQKRNTYRANYAALMQSLQSGATNYISIIEPARLPTVPVSPNVRMTILLAAAIGAGLAVAAAFLLEYLDDTIKTPVDVERVMGLTTLGAISSIPDVQEPADALISSLEPKSPVAEAYRVLRTNLQFAGVGKENSVFMVTSSQTSEGKTTTLANLGVVLAQAGKQVILVDTDLRRPSLHKLFGLANSIGLTSMLLDDNLGVQDALAPTSIPSLRLLCSGPRPPNPAELLENPRMDEIIAQLRKEADLVIFDTPPVLAVADATIMATKVNGVIMVVEMGSTRTEICRQSVQVLRQVNAHLMGAVMNKVTHRRGGYYYYYYDASDGTDAARRRRRRESSPLARAFPFLFGRSSRRAPTAAPEDHPAS